MIKNKPGRGRPPLAVKDRRVRVTLSLPPELARWLVSRAARGRASLSELSGHLLERARRLESQERMAWEARLGVGATELAALCRALEVRRLALFGSALGEAFRPDSDVDLLVEFKPGAGRDLFALGRAQQDLAALFGRDVDLVEAASLDNPIRRRAILGEAQEIYAAS